MQIKSTAKDYKAQKLPFKSLVHFVMYRPVH